MSAGSPAMEQERGWGTSYSGVEKTQLKFLMTCSRLTGGQQRRTQCVEAADARQVQYCGDSQERITRAFSSEAK